MCSMRFNVYQSEPFLAKRKYMLSLLLCCMRFPVKSSAPVLACPFFRDTVQHDAQAVLLGQRLHRAGLWPSFSLVAAPSYRQVHVCIHACLLFLWCSTPEVAHVGQITIYFEVDDLEPNVPLWDIVLDLYSADPTKEICPRSCRLCDLPPGLIS